MIYRVRNCSRINYRGKSHPAGAEIDMEENHAADILAHLEPTGPSPERPLVDAPMGKIQERRVWRRRASDPVNAESK